MPPERPILLELPNEIAGERVVVRPLRDEDAEPMHVAIRESVDHVRPWLPWYDKHDTLGDTLEFIRRSQAEWALRNNFPMGIFARADGRFLGGTGLGVRDWSVPAFEIGYWIRQSEEGKGYITESTRLVTTFAFEALGARRLLIRCNALNSRSKAVPERLGYVFEGRVRNAELDTSGNLADMLMYSMIPEDYERALASWEQE